MKYKISKNNLEVLKGPVSVQWHFPIPLFILQRTSLSHSGGIYFLDINLAQNQCPIFEFSNLPHSSTRQNAGS